MKKGDAVEIYFGNLQALKVQTSQNEQPSPSLFESRPEPHRRRLEPQQEEAPLCWFLFKK